MNLVIQEDCRVEELLLHIQRKQMRWLSQNPEEDSGCEGGVLSSGWLEEEPELMEERRRSGCLCPHSREWAATCEHVQTGTSSKTSLNNYFLIHPALVTSDVTEVKMCEVTPGSLRLIFTFRAEPRCCHWREGRGNRSRSRASGFMSLSITSVSKGCGMKMSHGSVWLRLRLPWLNKHTANSHSPADSHQAVRWCISSREADENLFTLICVRLNDVDSCCVNAHEELKDFAVWPPAPCLHTPTGKQTSGQSSAAAPQMFIYFLQRQEVISPLRVRWKAGN